MSQLSGISLRPERPDDTQTIRTLTEDAFRPKAFSDGTEGALIEALRKASALTISTVAVERGEIVGHVAFSPATVGQLTDWFALGPIAVRPDRQRCGIGSLLIQDGIDRLRRDGAQGCVLEGDPNYYSRFGFVTDAGLTYGGEFSRFIQVVRFSGPGPAGEVRFHPAFSA
ncbi:GNAT family N-acetyltransferase [Litoreibacter janthinus]|uniref:Putative acetyltransferase n=1 Tax=Litoreibacter janthinus TaxID=670154 RepID=A0A1I6G8C3_9RHOB|nr:N-acetyltransferase [Litoreibacter janthinus]SFR38442.1 putative acetyltransferase [Litoreibacter janthinus]